MPFCVLFGEVLWAVEESEALISYTALDQATDGPKGRHVLLSPLLKPTNLTADLLGSQQPRCLSAFNLPICLQKAELQEGKPSPTDSPQGTTEPHSTCIGQVLPCTQMSILIG